MLLNKCTRGPETNTYMYNSILFLSEYFHTITSKKAYKGKHNSNLDLNTYSCFSSSPSSYSQSEAFARADCIVLRSSSVEITVTSSEYMKSCISNMCDSSAFLLAYCVSFLHPVHKAEMIITV